MIALLSVISLLLLWILLATIEQIAWPLSRNTGLYSNDPDYLVAVQRDTAAYLATHTNVGATVRSSVEVMGRAAQQRLQGVKSWVS